MVFKKIIFQNSLMANETPSRPPPPLMANAIKNFHFDYVTTSLRHNDNDEDDKMMMVIVMVMIAS